MTPATLDQATTLSFFARMNEQGVDYAVLRNYEQYPKFGHDIDLIVRWSHLSRWKAIAAECAAEHKWSALTECDHWARSSCREHTIQILRFYLTEPLEYLQIDAFHALLVNGLPLFDEDALLRGRVWDERGFFRIDERAENFFRLFQISRLAAAGAAREKVERYRERALSFWNTAGDLGSYSSRLGFSGIEVAMEHLRAGDLSAFRQAINRQKRAWWTAKMLSHPLRGGGMILSRSADYMRLFWLRPCGFTVHVSAPPEQRGLIETMMGRLVSANFIPAYTVSGSLKQRQRVMERGGLAVEWASAEHADLILDHTTNEEAADAKLITLLVGRHRRIF
jgi:hypothetical protein